MLNESLQVLAQPPVAIGIAVVFGLLIGSFLNVVILRLPVMMERQWQRECAELAAEGEAGNGNGELAENRTAEAAPAAPEPERFDLASPRSRCPSCGHAITAMENIPVLSWLWLRGRCSGCGTGISARYPIVELVTAALSALVIHTYGATFIGFCALALTYALIVLALIDADTTLLPDSITLPFLWFGIAFNMWGGFVPLDDAVLGAMAGYLTLWTVYHAFKLITGKEGMGFGDFKLLAMLGAWLGWTQLPVIVLLSSVVGAVVGVSLMVFARHGRDVPIPFGPYLAIAGFLAMLFGSDLSNAWLEAAAPPARY